MLYLNINFKKILADLLDSEKTFALRKEQYVAMPVTVWEQDPAFILDRQPNPDLPNPPGAQQ